ncbi:MAG: flagellar biosynthesis anti-sigma factor FlgM [Actinomycetota bacterium]
MKTQISDREIANSLRLVYGNPCAQGTCRLPDPEETRKVFTLIQRLPEVRGEKVEVLRKAIQESRYYVPSEAVAQKLLGRIIADRLV